MLKIFKMVKYKKNDLSKKLLSEDKLYSSNLFNDDKSNKQIRIVNNEDTNLIKKNAENERNSLIKELGLENDATWGEITKKYDELFTLK